MAPLVQAGLSRDRPDLRTMEMDMSMPRISDHDGKLFRGEKKEEESRGRPDQTAVDHVPGSVEPNGPPRSRSVVRRVG
eukprot:4698575-Pyramimonas_sp.AAC.1